MKYETINYKDWKKKYKPIENKITKEQNYYNKKGVLQYGWFDTDDEDFDYVCNQNELNVWTEREEDGKTYMTSGLGFVNRICYFITEVARQEDEKVTVEEE
jgi:hypothetical protein